MYERILVPTDGSDPVQAAIERAINLALTYDASLHTVYVVDTAIGAGAGAGPLTAIEETGEAAIKDVMGQAEVADLGTVEGSVARGAPHQAIIDYVDEYDIDIVVMGTHGRSGLDRMLLGSVTEKVLRQSAVPVLAVPSPGASTDADG